MLRIIYIIEKSQYILAVLSVNFKKGRIFMYLQVVLKNNVSTHRFVSYISATIQFLWGLEHTFQYLELKTKNVTETLNIGVTVTVTQSSGTIKTIQNKIKK